MASSDEKQMNEQVPSSEVSQNIEQVAGTSGSSAPLVVAEENATPSDKYIHIRVITSDLSNEVHFRVKPHTPMIRLKKSYCKTFKSIVDELRFVFDGSRIADSDTTKSLGMIDGDVIEIFQEKLGGSYM